MNGPNAETVAAVDTTPLYPLAAMPGAAAVLDIVLDALTHPAGLKIHRQDTFDGGLGDAVHETNSIHIAPDASREQARCALLACLLHLTQEMTEDETADNRAVSEKVAGLLVPAVEADADPNTIAARYGVDLPTARLALKLAAV